MAFYIVDRLFCQVLKIIFMYLVSLMVLFLESLLEVRVFKLLMVSNAQSWLRMSQAPYFMIQGVPHPNTK